MKKLTPPLHIDDAAIANGLSNNKALASYPHLFNNLDLVITNYHHYVEKKGNPWHISPLPLDQVLLNAIETHYLRPPKKTQLDFIAELRAKGSPDVCPMCGSLGTGTLDHILPRAKYPELSILSRNLVPACNCNSLRNADFKGIHLNQRVLHPYFEDCLRQRILSCIFNGDLDFPNVELTICCGPMPELDAIEFHIETVVKRTNIIFWLIKKWSRLKLMPQSVISTLQPNYISNQAQVKQAVAKLLNDKDAEFETPNNWESVFLHGVLNSPGALDWLVKQHNDLLDQTLVPE